MAQKKMTGEQSFKTLDHIESYPVVHSAIETFKANPYGAKSIDLTQTGYTKFVSPMVPYAARPYSYVAPLVSKADSFASSGLDRVDQTFPIVKQDTEKLKSHLVDVAYFPFRLANDGKEYVFQTYGAEYKKCGGEGYVSSGKALITTSMVVTSDTLAWLSEFLTAKKQEGAQYAEKGRAFIGDKSTEALNYAQGKKEHAKKSAKEHAPQ